jgi:hypothetical protein
MSTPMPTAPKKKAAPGFRVKPRNRETRFVKLRSLKCFQEMHDRILQGWPLPEVARFIQEDNDEYTDVTRDGLVVVLKEYRQSIPPAQLIAPRMPPVFKKAAEEVREGLDELKELEELYRKQMKRIEIDMQTESKINKLLPTMTQEMRVAGELLGRIADLKMDLGLSQRHLGTMNLDGKLTAEIAGRFGSEAVAQVAQNPESRRKVLGLAERLLQLAAKKKQEGDPEFQDAPEQQEIDLVEGGEEEPEEGEQEPT